MAEYEEINPVGSGCEDSKANNLVVRDVKTDTNTNKRNLSNMFGKLNPFNRKSKSKADHNGLFDSDSLIASAGPVEKSKHIYNPKPLTENASDAFQYNQFHSSITNSSAMTDFREHEPEMNAHELTMVSSTSDDKSDATFIVHESPIIPEKLSGASKLKSSASRTYSEFKKQISSKLKTIPNSYWPIQNSLSQRGSKSPHKDYSSQSRTRSEQIGNSRQSFLKNDEDLRRVHFNLDSEQNSELQFERTRCLASTGAIPKAPYRPRSATANNVTINPKIGSSSLSKSIANENSDMYSHSAGDKGRSYDPVSIPNTYDATSNDVLSYHGSDARIESILHQSSNWDARKPDMSLLHCDCNTRRPSEMASHCDCNTRRPSEMASHYDCNSRRPSEMSLHNDCNTRRPSERSLHYDCNTRRPSERSLHYDCNTRRPSERSLHYGGDARKLSDMSLHYDCNTGRPSDVSSNFYNYAKGQSASSLNSASNDRGQSASSLLSPGNSRGPGFSSNSVTDVRGKSAFPFDFVGDARKPSDTSLYSNSDKRRQFDMSYYSRGDVRKSSDSSVIFNVDKPSEKSLYSSVGVEIPSVESMIPDAGASKLWVLPESYDDVFETSRSLNYDVNTNRNTASSDSVSKLQGNDDNEDSGHYAYPRDFRIPNSTSIMNPGYEEREILTSSFNPVDNSIATTLNLPVGNSKSTQTSKKRSTGTAPKENSASNSRPESDYIMSLPVADYRANSASIASPRDSNFRTTTAFMAGPRDFNCRTTSASMAGPRDFNCRTTSASVASPRDANYRTTSAYMMRPCDSNFRFTSASMVSPPVADYRTSKASIINPHATYYRTSTASMINPPVADYRTSTTSMINPPVADYRTSKASMINPHATYYRTSTASIIDPPVADYRTSTASMINPPVTDYKTSMTSMIDPPVADYRTSTASVINPIITSYRRKSDSVRSPPSGNGLSTMMSHLAYNNRSTLASMMNPASDFRTTSCIIKSPTVCNFSSTPAYMVSPPVASYNTTPYERKSPADTSKNTTDSVKVQLPMMSADGNARRQSVPQEIPSNIRPANVYCTCSVFNWKLKRGVLVPSKIEPSTSAVNPEYQVICSHCQLLRMQS